MAKERREQVEKRYRQKQCNDQTADEHGTGVVAPQLTRLLAAAEPPGSRLEILATEQVAIAGEEGDEVDAGHQKQGERDEIDQDDHAGKEQCVCDRLGATRRTQDGVSCFRMTYHSTRDWARR